MELVLFLALVVVAGMAVLELTLLIQANGVAAVEAVQIMFILLLLRLIILLDVY
ncbi:MAG: hypothetical protein MSA15_13000 [Clostridium sp.]|nr:hypothetical protein [Clostridium sp.]